MKQHTKFVPQAEQHAEQQQTHAHAVKEFSSAEELLRFDAAQTHAPAEVAKRLQISTAQLPPPPARAWWKNLFGG